MASGTLHSLPSPVTRRNQKTVKSEWFEVLRKTREAEGEVGEMHSWLASRNTGTATDDDDPGQWSGAMRWSKREVVTELGGVLKLGLPRGESGDVPPVHAGFTRLKFGHPAAVANVSRAREEMVLDEDEEEEGDYDARMGRDADDLERRGGAASRMAEKALEGERGWLGDDAIDDF